MIAFTAATMNSVISNSQAVMLLIRLERIRHRIDSMYRHMKILERNMEKVDVTTLVHMANWFVNPNSDSVVHVLTLLHLELMGRSDDHGFRWDRSGLNLLVKYYHVSMKEINKLY